MLLFIINVGRLTIVVSAAILIAVFVIIGWRWGVNLDLLEYNFQQVAVPTPNRLLFAALGLAAGVILAGSVLGLIAAVFDIQRSLRALVKLHSSPTTVGNLHREKASAPGSTRTEPRLANVAVALVITAFAATPVQAQVDEEPARCSTIQDNTKRLSCYDKAFTPLRPNPAQDYKSMRLVDLKVDLEELRGSKVAVPGFLKLVNGDVAFLSTVSSGIGPYVSVNTKPLSRELRILLVTKCVSGCSVITYGSVGTVGFGFPIGVIADKFELVQ